MKAEEFKRMMSSLADEIEQFGIRVPEGDTQSKDTFGSIMSSALNLNPEQR